MYKLIAFDLDNTLLDDKKEISNYNLKVIKELQKKDIEIVIATGRSYISAKKLIEELGNDITLICNNGAIIRNNKADKTLYETNLQEEIACRIIEEGDKRDLNPIVHVNGYSKGYDVLVREKDNMIEDNSKNPRVYIRYELVEKFTPNILENILSIAYFGERDKIKEFHWDMVHDYHSYFSSHIMENFKNNRSLVEFMSVDANKWKTLKKYANSKGIEDNEIITFGDDNNDIEMIYNAGLGVAMKNANAKVKLASDIITKVNYDESGVGVELRRIFKLK